MKKIMMMMAAVMLLSSVDANAQSFLKKLKDKVKEKVEKKIEDKVDKTVDSEMDGLLGDSDSSSKAAKSKRSSRDDDGYSNESSSSPKITVAQGSDIVPKRKTSTIVWDGTVTPSSASSAQALMRELPPLPSAEKMARSTMEERDAYTLKIAAVVARAEQLQAAARECSDADMEALRNKWENKIQDLFGLTKEEMAILNDENAPESKKEPIQQKIMMKIMGGNVDMNEMERFEKMSEKEQQAYIKAHPEFVQKMMDMGQNASNFSKQVQQMTGGINTYETQIGQLMVDHVKMMENEAKHSYDGIARKYEGKLQKLYNQICATNDAAKIDALYAEADELLYNYRLEAAQEYRASLQRQIQESKKFAAEFARLSQEVVQKGDLPACAVARTDLNAVIMAANLLDDAYDELPELEASPVCKETIYELQKGWQFGSWECRGYIGDVSDFKTPGSDWPLLAWNDDTNEYAVVERGKFRKINENELQEINKKADARQKKGANMGKTPPYGVFKSRSGKRKVEYSKTGEIIINGMTNYAPVAFTAYPDRLEWIIIDGSKIVKCTYKL